MKRVFFYAGLIVIKFTIILSGCTPKTVAPSSQATPGAITPPLTRPATPQLSADEVVWNKVVEASKKEGKLTIYSYSWVGDAGMALSRAFKNKYGIELDLITGRGSEFIERLKTEKRMGRMTADIFEGSPSHLPGAKDAGTWY